MNCSDKAPNLSLMGLNTERDTNIFAPIEVILNLVKHYVNSKLKRLRFPAAPMRVAALG
jgi:hypothetical protein